MLGGDVSVPQPVGLALGSFEHLLQGRVHGELTASDLGMAAQFTFGDLPEPFDADARFLQNRNGNAALLPLVEKRQQKMQRFYLGMIGRGSPLLGTLKRFRS